MEMRRVQKVGYSSLGISLPSKWVKGVGLKRGDLVLCDGKADGSLSVVPQGLMQALIEKEKVEFSVNADLCDEPRMLERIVVGSYLLGRENITVRSSNRIKPEHIEEVRRISTRLLGLGIMEEYPDRIILQCSIDPTSFPFNTLIKRLYIISSAMHKQAMESLFNFDLTLARDVIQRENEADMLYWLIMRLLIAAQRDVKVAQQIGIENRVHILGNRLIAKYLETIGDYAENIARNVIQLRSRKNKIRGPLDGSLARMSRSASEICDSAINSLFSRDIKLANQAIERKEAMEKEEEDFIRESHKYTDDADSLANLRSIAWSLMRIGEYGSSIAFVAINRYLDRPSKICSQELRNL